MSIDSNLDNFVQNNGRLTDTNLGSVFGAEALNPGTEYSPWVDQYYSDTCAIRSQQIILRDYGINISQEQLISMAEANGWYKTGEGTSIEHVGKLMELVGVDCQQSYNNTIYDLVSELSQGHRIIVSVDSGELWTNTFYDVMTEKIEDLSGIQGADHALIVAGVEVNPENPHDVKVVLTDPGTGKLRVEYSLSDFIDAWKDSNCFMVATEEPAPYQFDPVTCMEVPSGFATDYNISSMAIDNDFLLADNEIGILDDYTPTYSEINHIDTSIYFSDIKPIDLVDTIEDHNPLDSDFIELLS